jgi:archaellin
MKYDEKNVIAKDVLTNEEIRQIEIAIKNSNGSAFVEVHSQLNNFIELPQNIIDKFTKYAREISGNSNIILTEYCHAKYANQKNENGKVCRPSLFPHYDETFTEPRFTLDYQYKSNVDWDIVVEPDKSFKLKDNEAITFAGTHQIHWRTPKEFKDDEFVEMIFCHFTDPTSGPKDIDVNKIMDIKAKEYKSKFFANGGFTNVPNA